VLLASFLRHLIGFRADVLQIALLDPHLQSLRLLLGSWFPWVAFATAGAVFFRAVFGARPGTPGALHLAAAGLTATGLLSLFTPVDQNLMSNLVNGGILEPREGYSEIFYPATPAFVIASLGVVMSLAILMRDLPVTWPLRALAFFGNCSMLVYVLHLAIGRYVIKSGLGRQGMDAIESGPVFLLIVLLTVGAIAIVCAGTAALKRRRAPRSIFMQVLVGR
jgi:hypothetical protein